MDSHLPLGMCTYTPVWYPEGPLPNQQARKENVQSALAAIYKLMTFLVNDGLAGSPHSIKEITKSSSWEIIFFFTAADENVRLERVKTWIIQFLEESTGQENIASKISIEKDGPGKCKCTIATSLLLSADMTMGNGSLPKTGYTPYKRKSSEQDPILSQLIKLKKDEQDEVKLRLRYSQLMELVEIYRKVIKASWHISVLPEGIEDKTALFEMILDRAPMLWGKLLKVFDRPTSGENALLYKELCQLCNAMREVSSTILSGNYGINQLEIIDGKLELYHDEVLPALYRYVESKSQEYAAPLLSIVQLSLKMLGSDYQIACTFDPDINVNSESIGLIIAAPSTGNESVGVLLIEKLRTLLGAAAFNELVDCVEQKDQSCFIAFDIGAMKKLQDRLVEFASLSVDALIELHILVTAKEVICRGKLDEALEMLARGCTNKISDESIDKLVIAFRQFVELYARFCEALVSDGKFRSQLRETYGRKFNADYIKSDSMRLIDSFISYFDQNIVCKNAIEKIFIGLEMDGENGLEKFNFVHDCLVSTSVEGEALLDCWSRLGLLWMNFFGYFHQTFVSHGPDVAEVTVCSSNAGNDAVVMISDPLKTGAEPVVNQPSLPGLPHTPVRNGKAHLSSDFKERWNRSPLPVLQPDNPKKLSKHFSRKTIPNYLSSPSLQRGVKIDYQLDEHDEQEQLEPICNFQQMLDEASKQGSF